MKTRVISGIVITIVALAIIIPGGYILAGALYILSLIAYRELMKAIKLAGYRNEQEKGEVENSIFCFSSLEIIGYFGITLFYLLMLFLQMGIFLLVSVIITLVIFMGFFVFTFPKYNCRQIMMSMFCFIYGPIMLTFIYMTRMLTCGKYMVWMIFISSWVCDVAAYFSGMLLGKHKLAPVLSPKKSIEGAVGGVLGSALFAAAYALVLMKNGFVNDNVVFEFAVIAAVGSAVSQVGDLAASGIKRNEGIKDYGKLIPGHGGVMDRFDSVIFTAPMIYLLSLILL